METKPQTQPTKKRTSEEDYLQELQTLHATVSQIRKIVEDWRRVDYCNGGDGYMSRVEAALTK